MKFILQQAHYTITWKKVDFSISVYRESKGFNVTVQNDQKNGKQFFFNSTNPPTKADLIYYLQRT